MNKEVNAIMIYNKLSLREARILYKQRNPELQYSKVVSQNSTSIQQTRSDQPLSLNNNQDQQKEQQQLIKQLQEQIVQLQQQLLQQQNLLQQQLQKQELQQQQKQQEQAFQNQIKQLEPQNISKMKSFLSLQHDNQDYQNPVEPDNTFNTPDIPTRKHSRNSDKKIKNNLSRTTSRSRSPRSSSASSTASKKKPKEPPKKKFLPMESKWTEMDT
jgi:hypothetical protein